MGGCYIYNATSNILHLGEACFLAEKFKPRHSRSIFLIDLVQNMFAIELILNLFLRVKFACEKIVFYF